jgi:hypothetical protein
MTSSMLPIDKITVSTSELSSLVRYAAEYIMYIKFSANSSALLLLSLGHHKVVLNGGCMGGRGSQEPNVRVIYFVSSLIQVVIVDQN